MQTQDPSPRTVAAIAAFILSSVVLTLYIWTSFGGPLPLSAKGYQLHVLFPKASNLAANADVRMAGVNVGRVLTVAHKGLATDATIELDSRYAPMPADAHAIIRNKTLLGETYIGLSPGTPGAPKLRDGGLLPRRNVQPIQSIDDVLGAFDAPARARWKTFVNEFARGLRGRGQDINDALGNLAPTAADLGAVARALDRERGAVGEILEHGSSVLQTLGSRPEDLRRIVTAGNQTFAATASRDREITATVNALPTLLRDLRATMTAVDSTAAAAAPTVRGLAQAGPLVPPALDAARRLAPEIRKTFEESLPVVKVLDPGLRAVNRLLDAVNPAFRAVADALAQGGPWVELLALYRKDFVGVIANTGSAYQAKLPGGPRGDPLHVLRGFLHYSNETLLGHATRTGSNRHNPYMKPGALKKFETEGSLDSFDCRHAGNANIVPVIGSGSPPCREQGAWTFQGKSRRYPRVTARPHIARRDPRVTPRPAKRR